MLPLLTYAGSILEIRDCQETPRKTRNYGLQDFQEIQTIVRDRENISGFGLASQDSGRYFRFLANLMVRGNISGVEVYFRIRGPYQIVPKSGQHQIQILSKSYTQSHSRTFVVVYMRGLECAQDWSHSGVLDL